MALIEKLNAIGEAIRAKTGGTEKLTLDAMPTEIAAIETGGGGGDLPEEAFVLIGNCEYRFANGGWDWFIKAYANKITTKDVEGVSNMFAYSSSLSEIPFDINLKNKAPSDFTSMFNCCYSLEHLPLIKGDLPTPTSNYSGNPAITYFIYGCHRLREIPYDYFDNFGGEAFWNGTKQYTKGRGSLFSSCYSLRKLPDIKNLMNLATGTSCLYYSFCNGCYALDEAIDIPVSQATLTSNCFSSFMTNANRLKNLTFETNEDGSAKVANWKSQTIDLSAYVGYTRYTFNVTTNYNSGITSDKQVTDDASYQALKDDPDWYTTDIAYSRYNHDSAVATINSLPDTSAAGGTNTIKFKGGSGAYTNGSDVATGGVENLTEAEIAVAAAKGWTVSIA